VVAKIAASFPPHPELLAIGEREKEWAELLAIDIIILML
jgi:hypothetical protein